MERDRPAFCRTLMALLREPISAASSSPQISADGRFVVFVSGASNLVTNDTNGVNDIFVRDRLKGNTTLVSIPPAGGLFTSACKQPSISGDGLFIVFVNGAHIFL